MLLESISNRLRLAWLMGVRGELSVEFKTPKDPISPEVFKQLSPLSRI